MVPSRIFALVTALAASLASVTAPVLIAQTAPLADVVMSPLFPFGIKSAKLSVWASSSSCWM